MPSWPTFVLATCLVAAAAASEPASDGRLVLLGPDFAMQRIDRHASEVTLTGSADAPALRLTTEAHGSWPGMELKAADGHWDLSAYEFLAIDVRNLCSHDIQVAMRIDNPGANGRDNCTTDGIGAQPDQRVTITIPLRRKAQSGIKLFGMNGFPQGMYASGGIDPANIVALTIFVGDKPQVSDTFEVSNFRVFGSYHEPAWLKMDAQAFFPMIDRYGQFRHKEWPGKIHGDDELAARRDAEASALAADRGPQDWDQWGGWSAGPQLEKTGHFRTAKVDGKWWLVDPDGRLFFSVGLTCVGFGCASTPIDDRESWFQDLPAKDDPVFGQFRYNGGKSWGGGYYQGKSPFMYDFSKANLLRKYGADWQKTYPELVQKRLRAWGLNTVGNWSDQRFCSRTPYCRTFWYDSPRMQDNHVGFPDVFDPGFGPAVAKGMAQHCKGTFEDPWCIGYFLDNEMPWGGEETLARYALASPAKQAAKQRLAAWLKERHPEIADLDTAWGTTWASWDAFLADTKAHPSSDAARADLAAFTGLAAETYFSTIKDAMRAAAPHKLYLGCRCVGGAANLVRAAAKYCDVVSYNRYCASVRDIRLGDGIDAPMIIGEFHFGGLDRGPFWSGLFYAVDQADRARKFTAYIESALDNPQIVGAHWFQYGDEAATGRIDGENAQCGFIDVCDTPYAETIEAARASADAMYRRRR